RPDLFLKTGRTRAEHEVAVAPLLGWRHRRQAGFFPDDSAQQHFEIAVQAAHALALTHERHGLVSRAATNRSLPRPGRRGSGLAIGRRVPAPRLDPGTAPIVVLAPAVAARDPHRLTPGVNDDDAVHAVELAGAAVVFNRFARAVRAHHRHRASIIARGRHE